MASPTLLVNLIRAPLLVLIVLCKSLQFSLKFLTIYAQATHYLNEIQRKKVLLHRSSALITFDTEAAHSRLIFSQSNQVLQPAKTINNEKRTTYHRFSSGRLQGNWCFCFLGARCLTLVAATFFCLFSRS